ncbi:hypothetical protein M404DRAFT_23676 [Pisolithus tinctorius Marx 270]|uniref:Uncharacterized protein n=1 Tax=Pisolithus tinctorius Marx 270 TaxID=870435 RepID=A0A0C3PIF8_PISTI|nr:hypothetical protein M404DRAFT_23676 [Pisolithus tinctorius Marx 270]
MVLLCISAERFSSPSYRCIPIRGPCPHQLDPRYTHTPANGLPAPHGHRHILHWEQSHLRTGSPCFNQHDPQVPIQIFVQRPPVSQILLDNRRRLLLTTRIPLPIQNCLPDHLVRAKRDPPPRTCEVYGGNIVADRKAMANELCTCRCMVVITGPGTQSRKWVAGVSGYNGPMCRAVDQRKLHAGKKPTDP